MEPKHGIGYYFKLISKSLETLLKKDLAEYNLTLQQLNILIYLFKNSDNEINQKMVEEHFELSSPTISGILKRLEIKNLIARKVSSKDHRDKIICLSEKGSEIKEEIFQAMKKNDENILRGFSKIEKDELLDYLFRIKKNIEEVL